MTWLFENPIAILSVGAMLVVLATVVHLQIRTRGSLLSVFAVVLATAALLAVERLVVTPREEVAQTLDDLTKRIAANDLPGVVSFIEPGAKQVRADAESLMPLVTVDRAKIIGAPEIAVETAGIPPTATVNCQAFVDVTVKQNGIKGPYLDRVEIHFVREGDRWLIESFTPQKDWHHAIGRSAAGPR